MCLSSHPQVVNRTCFLHPLDLDPFDRIPPPRWWCATTGSFVYSTYPDEDPPANCILSDFDVNRLLEQKQDPIRTNPDFSAFPGDFIKEGIIRRTRETAVRRLNFGKAED